MAKGFEEFGFAGGGFEAAIFVTDLRDRAWAAEQFGIGQQRA